MKKPVYNRKLKARKKKKPSFWKRFLIVVLLLLGVKLVYEIWATEGKFLDALLFRYRMKTLTAGDIQKLEPSGFVSVSEDRESEASADTSADVVMEAKVPQLTYYGLVVPQSRINQAIHRRIDRWYAVFQKEANAHPASDAPVTYRYSVVGHITYFSRHVVSLRIDVKKESPEKETMTDYLVIGVASGDALTLQDILKTDESSCMSLETMIVEQLYYRGITSDKIVFNCRTQPFVLDPVGITLFHVVPEDDTKSVKVTFSEYPDFFLSDSPVGPIVFP